MRDRETILWDTVPVTIGIYFPFGLEHSNGVAQAWKLAFSFLTLRYTFFWSAGIPEYPESPESSEVSPVWIRTGSFIWRTGIPYVPAAE